MKPNSRRKSVAPAQLQIRHILVPMDFSDFARQALRHAIPLATGFGAKITLLHVVELPVYPTEMGTVVVHQERTAGASRKELAALGEKLIPASLRGRVLVCMGRPYEEIARTARRLKADLIVLTTHGYTGLKHVLLGSTAERVVRHAPCPVLTVRGK